MEELKRELRLGDEVGLIVVNVGDYALVEAAVTQTRFVTNSVGPYQKYADNVVQWVLFSLILRVVMGTHILAELVPITVSIMWTWLERFISSKP